MNDFELRFDADLPLSAGGLGHNRWHPDIPPVARVQAGQVVAFRTRDGSDGQISPATRGEDFMAIDTDAIHSLTGPFFIEGAEPGDQLRVEVLGIEPSLHGVTLVWPGSGFGLLPEDFEEPLIVHWEIRDGVARSPEMPGVVIEGRPFLGIMGVAPSHARMAEITAREARLAASGFAVLAPDPNAAAPSGGAPAAERPPHGPAAGDRREYGHQATDGRERRHAPGRCSGRAVLSRRLPLRAGRRRGHRDGDRDHGNGTPALRGREAGAQRWQPRFPTFEYREQPARTARRYIATTGIPVDRDGQNGYLDLTMAAKEAVREMITCLHETRGLTRTQAYVLVSVAGDLRISECVDVPNALVSVHLPLDVFDAERQDV